MFDGFQLDRVDVGEVTLRVRYGGEGEPVVLLHGHPRTHTTWYRVAPQLSSSFFVVCPDLRGYGQSTLPPDAPGHAQSAKRARERRRPAGFFQAVADDSSLGGSLVVSSSQVRRSGGSRQRILHPPSVCPSKVFRLAGLVDQLRARWCRTGPRPG